MLKHYDIQVFGKVQGVFYRDSTEAEASKLNLVGWVKNESDGSVTIAAEGEEENLQKLVQWCKDGPQHAAVDQVKVSEGPVQNYKDFLVL